MTAKKLKAPLLQNTAAEDFRAPRKAPIVHHVKFVPDERVAAPGRTKLSALIAELEATDANGHFRKARQDLASRFKKEEQETLRSLRMSKGLSQAQLAAKIGTTQSLVSNYECGAREMTAQTMLKFSEALNVDYNTLLPIILSLKK